MSHPETDRLREKSTSLRADGLRFAIAGLANTAFTLALYQILLSIATPTASYALSWLAGIALVSIFYPAKVFAAQVVTASQRLLIAFSYAFVFLLGIAALRLLIDMGVSSRLAVVGVMALTTVANFFFGRYVSRWNKRQQRKD